MYKMEKKHRIIVGIVVVIMALGTITVIIFPQSLTTPAPVATDEPIAPRNDLADPNLNAATSTGPEALADQIVVTSPKETATVSTPLTVEGKARGNWYFEGTFPVELVDYNTGLDIGEGSAKATGDWMTDDFVPFTAVLTFDKPSTTTPAILVLKKDNPSGLPENDASISIPLVVK